MSRRERVATPSCNKDKEKQEKERTDEKPTRRQERTRQETKARDREFVYPFCCSFPNLASRPLVPVSAVILAWCCFLCFAKLPGPFQSVFRLWSDRGASRVVLSCLLVWWNKTFLVPSELDSLGPLALIYFGGLGHIRESLQQAHEKTTRRPHLTRCGTGLRLVLQAKIFAIRQKKMRKQENIQT